MLYFQIARFGSGVSSYIAILSDVTLPIVPMIIFSIFSLFAGVLVLFLPETRDRPLPDTLQVSLIPLNMSVLLKVLKLFLNNVLIDG